MKRHKLAISALLLLLLTSLLTACGQKESNHKTDPKAEQAIQKGEQTNHRKETNTENDQPKEKNSQHTQNNETNHQEATTKESQATTNTQVSSVIPEALIGTWTGTSQQATDVVMIISLDGAVSTMATFDANEGPRTNTAQLTQVQDLGNNLYVLSFEGNVEAIMPGITGLGGAGFRVAQGFKIVNNSLTPVGWTAPLNQDFDYTQTQEFGFALTRQ